MLQTGGGNEQELQLQQAYEPDEIIWDNLQYTKDQQNVRLYFMYFISVIMIAVAIYITLMLGALEKFFETYYPDPFCP